jgi:hypothetical protein
MAPARASSAILLSTRRSSETVLTRAQGDAVLADLNRAVAAAQQRAEQNREEGESGIVAGVLGIFGADHTSQLDAQVGAVRMVGSAVARLASDLPAAVDDEAAGDRWIDAAQSTARTLVSMDADITEATIGDTLRQTATATGTQVRKGITTAAEEAGGFVWNALPWWVIALGAAGVLGIAYLKLRPA